MYKVGIVGLGHVGSCMQKLFPDAIIYDEPKGIGTKEAINECDFTFICVPTPQGKLGECDTTIVEDICKWIKSKYVIIRSTVPVGFTGTMVRKYNIRAVFQPEYYGETVDHPFEDPHNRPWITLGGMNCYTAQVGNLYKTVFNANLVIHKVASNVAELAKYMENCYYATKVVFCNEFYEIAKAMGVDYDQLRETWLLDPRINRSHTFVYPDNRGYGGSCLPKDTNALMYQAARFNVGTPLLSAVDSANKYYKEIEPFVDENFDIC